MTPFTYYHAGALFNLRELIGNDALCAEIDLLSGGKYQGSLPQHITASKTGKDLRDASFLMLLQCDLALFNFDGPDLDSGTVAEFMFAKSMDIPAVILRTDLRKEADNDAFPWNLMLGGYPRTVIVSVNAMDLLQRRRKALPVSAAAAASDIASCVIEAFDQVRAMPPVMPLDARLGCLQWVLKSNGLEKSFAAAGLTLGGILARKIEQNML